MAKKPVDRSVESLKTLLAQINKLAPKRSKISDGWIGDKAHMARHSDHNPEPDGTVDARDFTNDPSGGCDMRKVCDAIAASRDPRISYMICNGQIMNGHTGKQPWVWRKYTGTNGHYHHGHISVLDEGQDDTTPWKIEKAFKAAPKMIYTGREKIEPQKKPDADHDGVEDVGIGFPGDFKYKDGNYHKELEAVQKRLDELGYPEVGAWDGKWGSRTQATVLAFRADNGMPTVPDIDAGFLAGLMTAEHRAIAPARAEATVADLRAEGAEEVKGSDKNQIVGYALAAGGVVKATSETGLLDKAEQAGGIIQRVTDLVAPIQGFISDNLWLLLLGGGAFVVWQSGVLKNLRLVKHQTGQDVSR